ncbi:MAG: L-seryl-tRNA(Sec) selenium transferase [Phycisphaerales bacterium]|nr:L-seryl-tRNA(Sec) selenium transferase [Phycisphaerales bacterium]
MTPQQAEQLRSLPAVGELLERRDVSEWCRTHARSSVLHALRAALHHARQRIRNGHAAEAREFTMDAIVATAKTRLESHHAPSLRPVINATGVVLHTGLGRAPLCPAAVRAVADAAGRYVNLEMDMETGERGHRTRHVAELLCDVTAAPAATVVNNNAAAVLLCMRALCDGREVIVSRGQLVEIGGSFRMPDVMTAGGVTLREVGTTNRTRIDDYSRAISDRTAALMRVHHSNFRMEGFVHEAAIEEIVECAHRHDLIAIDDVGSGALFDMAEIGLPHEPDVRRSITAGADIVCFSGDKLLGGPQSGIIVGRADLIARIESHPLMRTYRVDKLVLAALEATLRYWSDPQDAAVHVPTVRMIRERTESLAPRADRLHQLLADAMPDERFLISSDTSCAGGGSLPGEGLPSVVIRWQPSTESPNAAAAALRTADPPVVARVHDDAVCFDLRTIADHEFDPLSRAVASVCASGRSAGPIE